MNSMLFSSLTIAGAICGYLIGGGFASGQELLQYFASYGLKGLGAVAVSFLIMVFCVVNFLTVGKKENIQNAHDAFTYYCGKKAGSFFEFIAFTYLIVQVIVFFTGAGATIAQGFDVSPFVGSAIMGVLVIITVMLGLRKLIDIVGSLGVLLVVMVIGITGTFLLKNPSAIIEGSEQVATMSNILQPSKNWAVSGFLYMTFNLLGLAAFMPLLGQKSESQSENVFGGVLGGVAFCGTIVLVMLAFLTDIGNVGTKLVPNLYLAQQLHPTLASFFSIVILLGIYTGCAPMYWNFCSRVVPENSKYYKPFVIILGVFGIIFGSILPFDVAINIIYQIYGYLGTLFLFFVIAKFFMKKKSGK